MKSEWIKCPVCGEPDMHKRTNFEGEALITCTNHACGSNGGDNFSAVKECATLRRQNEMCKLEIAGLDACIQGMYGESEALRQQLQAKEAACAEMRDAIDAFRKQALYPGDCECHEFSTEKKMQWIAADKRLTIALSSDAGKGYVPFAMPPLHPLTAKLVLDFTLALAEKLSAAEKKYGWSDGWATPDAEDWPDPLCYQQLMEHIAKGDPRDVAAYCAFLWFHKLSTKPCMNGYVSKEELEKANQRIAELESENAGLAAMVDTLKKANEGMSADAAKADAHIEAVEAKAVELAVVERALRGALDAVYDKPTKPEAWLLRVEYALVKEPPAALREHDRELVGPTILFLKLQPCRCVAVHPKICDRCAELCRLEKIGGAP